MSAVRAATQILLSTLLYSGLFITAHDAMHGLVRRPAHARAEPLQHSRLAPLNRDLNQVCPGHRRLNDAIGAM